ncbi:MAG: IPT/TIG domain-containing protein [Proteobacteria bacterium]|nr:IPT/TIG domain-containing protein [Pseudomonadota bacterium]
MRVSHCFFALALSACGTGSTPVSDLCTVEAELNAAEGVAGDTITATGRPFSTRADTIVRVGGVDADVISAERSSECLLCDTCVDEVGCTGCETSCTECNALCADCTETVSFELPAIAAGPTEIVLLNHFGSTDPIDFVILDGDSGDTGYSGARRRSRSRGFRTPFTERRD